MRRYFIYLAYDGTLYHGWQIQPNGISVQERLERTISVLLRHPVNLVGAGRTDAGVHALMMTAHFDTPSPLDENLTVYRLNRMLPPDIVIHKIVEVNAAAHARFDAVSRTYQYFITNYKDPFSRMYALSVYTVLDFGAMNKAAALLLTNSDFTSFSKTRTDVKTNICHVTHAQWTKVDSGKWVFTIRANRFLRNMVRAIVGTLMEVGRGKLSLEGFQAVIDARDRCAAGTSMPGHGLFLTDIAYPPTVFAVHGPGA